jgi:hypothetical protein
MLPSGGMINKQWRFCDEFLITFYPPFWVVARILMNVVLFVPAIHCTAMPNKNAFREVHTMRYHHLLVLQSGKQVEARQSHD